LDFSSAFHLTSVWLFRLAIAAGVLGVAYLYVSKHGMIPDTPVASVQDAAPAAEIAIGACQPIGHTASGKLVYSMDCELLPAAPAAQ